MTALFYVISLILTYFDITKFRVPNLLVLPLMTLLIGDIFIIQSSINWLQVGLFIMTFVIITLLILLKQQVMFGGGDIKYLLAVSLYIDIFLFPLFLVLSGIFQSLTLFYIQSIKQRRIAPMVPAMFLAVASSELLYFTKLYPYHSSLL
jgi:Flp pilus assembly protein protease CpaA